MVRLPRQTVGGVISISIPFVENIVAALPIIILPSSLIALIDISSSFSTGIPIIILDAISSAFVYERTIIT